MTPKNHWQDKNILITGGSGLLGSEMVAQLIKKKANLTVIIRDQVAKSRFFSEGLYQKVNLVSGDITDFSLVERVIGENEIEVIFHLAAQAIVTIANLSPLSTFNSNIAGTWNVLEAARLHRERLQAVVVASSDKAYGPSDILPYNETLPLNGRYPYDVSKSCADLLAQSYFHTYQLPVIITRCGNLFGPGDLNFSRIIPGTIFSILKKERPFIRSDGKFVRNYFYIKDAVNGYLTIAEKIDKAAGQAFNLSTEETYSVLGITNLIIKLMNSRLKPLIKNEAKSEIKKQFLDIKKAKKILGWRPKYTTRAALKETIAWYRKNI